jgi:ElaB/YqjD/DUF883 family membrane-anchored ribosome-binding protein
MPIDMARQGNKMASQLEDMSKNLKESVDDASKNMRTSVERAQDNLRAGMDRMSKGVEQGKKVVKDHPVAALGIAIGATFAAGAIAGSQIERRMRKTKAAGKAKAS